MTTTAARTGIFDRFTTNDEWLGYGYLGERISHLTTTDSEAAPLAQRQDEVAIADAIVLAHAEAAGWSEDQLFAWANSKRGRWYADGMFGWTQTPAHIARARRELVLPVD